MFIIRYFLDGEEHFQVYQKQSRMLKFIEGLDKDDIRWEWIK